MREKFFPGDRFFNIINPAGRRNQICRYARYTDAFNLYSAEEGRVMKEKKGKKTLNMPNLKRQEKNYFPSIILLWIDLNQPAPNFIAKYIERCSRDCRSRTRSVSVTFTGVRVSGKRGKKEKTVYSRPNPCAEYNGQRNGRCFHRRTIRAEFHGSLNKSLDRAIIIENPRPRMLFKQRAASRERLPRLEEIHVSPRFV